MWMPCMRPANPAGGAELLILVKSAKSVESPKSAQALDAAGKASAPAHAPHLPPVGEAEKYLALLRFDECSQFIFLPSPSASIAQALG